MKIPALLLAAAAAAILFAGCAAFRNRDESAAPAKRETPAAEPKRFGFWGDIGGLSEQEYFSPGRH